MVLIETYKQQLLVQWLPMENTQESVQRYQKILNKSIHRQIRSGMSHHRTHFHTLQMPWDINCHMGLIKSFRFVKFLEFVMGLVTDVEVIVAPGRDSSRKPNVLLLSLPMSRSGLLRGTLEAGVGAGGVGKLAFEPLTGEIRAGVVLG